jgi:hypothetical protein
MDIRGRCGFINNGKGFRKCLARVNTGYFHLTNDYETYKKLEKSKTEKQTKEIIRKFCHDILGLISLDDKNKVFEMYKDERKDEDLEHSKEYPDHERCKKCDCCIGCECCECKCLECGINIDFKDDYDYDDDTGFYHCGACMPDEDQAEKCCECCEKPFNNTRNKIAGCCDCVYNDDGTITLLKDWAIIKKDETDDEEQPECCGKHCDQTKNLKLGLAFNPDHYGNVNPMYKEQLFCNYCYDDWTKKECKGCSESHNYIDLEYRTGYPWGNETYKYDSLFCKSCIDDINKRI